MSVVSAAKGLFLADTNSINNLANSKYEKNNYPVWTAYNGTSPSNDSTYENHKGPWYTFAFWRHYSTLFNDGYGSYVGNHMLNRVAEHNGTNRGENVLLDFSADAQPRILKMFGAESLFTGNTSGPGNNNADRGNGTTGEFNNMNTCRVVGNTGSSPGGDYINNAITSSTSMNNTSLWCRKDWTQIIDIPDNATTVKFGAQIKVGANDKLKAYNFAGIYCAEDNITTKTRTVNYFRIRHSTGLYSLPTGTLSSSASPYNWNGLTTSGAVDSFDNIKVFTPASTIVTEHASLNQNDYEEFKPVEYSFTPQSGTNRTMSFNLFFAENAYNLYQAAGDFTGGFQVFDPFVEFS